MTGLLPRSSVEIKVAIGFGLALAILAVMGAFSYHNTIAFSEMARRVAHTHEVLANIERVHTLVNDIEAGQRGFVITGQPRSLERYDSSTAAIEGALDDCHRLTADDPRQQQRLDELTSLVAARVAFARENVTLRKTQGFDAARQAVETDRERQVNQQVRSLIAAMKAAETDLLRRRQERASATARQTRWIVVLASLTASLLVAGASFLIRRDLRGRQRAEQKFQQLLESAPDALIIVNRDGKIVLANSQTDRLFGYSRAELLGQAIELLVPVRLREAHAGHRASYFQVPDARQMGVGLTLHGLRKDGSEFPAEIGLNPIETDEGVLIAAAVHDVTERRKAAEALERGYAELELRVQERTAELARSNADLEKFAYVSSHDLQEPLRTVASYVQLLERRYKGQLDQEADEFIRYAVDGAHRMQQLINDLLTYSRVGTRAQPLQPTDCEMVFDQAVQNLKIAIQESVAEVTHESLPTINADGGQLIQLFQNLLGNAIKFHNHQPPQVHVRAERRDGEWVFSVRDNGIGLDPKYADRIFTIFQRLHGRDKYPGTGIGLAICKKIVERHGGRIWVESRPEEGSVFYFSLPAKGDNRP